MPPPLGLWRQGRSCSPAAGLAPRCCKMRLWTGSDRLAQKGRRPRKADSSGISIGGPGRGGGRVVGPPPFSVLTDEPFFRASA